MDSLEISVAEANGSVDVNVAGAVDFTTAEQFEGALRNAIASARTAVNLDLQNVNFMDSTGIKVLVQSRQLAARTGISVRVVKASVNVQRLLRLMDLDDYFD